MDKRNLKKQKLQRSFLFGFYQLSFEMDMGSFLTQYFMSCEFLQKSMILTFREHLTVC